MADNEFETSVPSASQADSADLKKKIVEQSLKSVDHVQDDPTRSSLHYGKDEDPAYSIIETHTGDNPSQSNVDAADNDAAAQVDVVHERTAQTSMDPAASTPVVTENVGGDTASANTPLFSGGGRSENAAATLDLMQPDAAEKPAPAIGSEEPAAAATGHQSPPGEHSSADVAQDTGVKNTAPADIQLSNGAIAENVEGAVLGRLNVSDLDVEDTHVFSVSDDRFEILDGVVKLKDGVSLSADEAANLSLDITATDLAGAAVTEQFDIDVVEMPEVSLGSGFHAEYFDVDQTLRKLDDIDWDADPTFQELVEQIDYTNGRGSFWEGGDTDTFGAKITGNIEVEEGGTFDFFMGGDDGVVLFVNGIEVIEDDGLHSYRTRSGEIELEPGTHVIEVRYFENYGHAGLKLEWEGPGIEGRELVSSPPVEDLQTVNGMPLSVELNIGQSGENTSHTLEGLPPGSIVQLGSELVSVGDSGTVDISGKDFSVVQVTPPTDFTGTVSATVKTTVTLEDGDAATTQIPLDFEVNAIDSYTPQLDVQTGFKASYFDIDHSLNALDQIDWTGTPTHEEVVGEIDYENGAGSFWDGGAKDTFGAKITGDVTVEEGGVYNFYLGGDDGVVLYVNGAEVVEDDGLHSYRTRSGEIELEPGTHEIEIRYFENYGVAGLKLEWDGPGTDGRELVQADSDLSTVQNGAIDIRLDTSDFGSHGPATLSGLPADTVLVSGEMTAVADGNELVLEGWNLDLIEVMPPPGYEGEINVDVSVPFYAINGSEDEINTSFKIDVARDEASAQSDESQDDLVLLEQPSGAGGDARGWAHASGDGGQENNPDQDDIFEEAIVSGQDAEQTFEFTETYERQDW